MLWRVLLLQGMLSCGNLTATVPVDSGCCQRKSDRVTHSPPRDTPAPGVPGCVHKNQKNKPEESSLALSQELKPANTVPHLSSTWVPSITLYQFRQSWPTPEQQLPCLQNICALLGQTSFLLLTVGRIYTVGGSLQRSVKTQPSWASDKVPRLLHQQQSLDLRVWELNEFLKRNQEYRKHQSH